MEQISLQVETSTFDAVEELLSVQAKEIKSLVEENASQP